MRVPHYIFIVAITVTIRLCRDKYCKVTLKRNTPLYVPVTTYKTLFYAGSPTQRLIFPHFSAPVHEGQVPIAVLIVRQSF